jgi:hypothetical protein
MPTIQHVGRHFKNSGQVTCLIILLNLIVKIVFAYYAETTKNRNKRGQIEPDESPLNIHIKQKDKL